MTATMPADRATWLLARREGVGASDVPAILGVSPWASPWSVWAEKVGLIPLDRDDGATPEMRFGQDLEPVIAAMFERDTGLHVFSRQRMVRRPEAEWQFATVDGLVAEADPSRLTAPADALGVFESKYTGGDVWDDVPEYVRAQVTWQMTVTGHRAAWVAALHMPFGRPRFRVYELALDELYARRIVDAVEAFWFGHVVTGKAPLPDAHAATTEAIRLAWPERRPDPAVDVTELAPLIREIRRRRDQKSALERQLTADTNIVLGALGVFAHGFVDGAPAVRVTMSERRTVDAAAVRADHGDRYDKVSDPSPRLYLLGDFK